jgi:hypothetical protein
MLYHSVLFTCTFCTLALNSGISSLPELSTWVLWSSHSILALYTPVSITYKADIYNIVVTCLFTSKFASPVDVNKGSLDRFKHIFTSKVRYNSFWKQVVCYREWFRFLWARFLPLKLRIMDFQRKIPLLIYLLLR